MVIIRKKTNNNKKKLKMSLRIKKNLLMSKDKGMALLKTSQSGLKQVDNYRAFLRYLLSDKFDNELVD